ncbi:S8 family serine peptidase [Candidatus Gracilibacteria bacterium]|nr:S8 family serine peptidase [Candidatus Gracilibacteria bacterium]
MRRSIQPVFVFCLLLSLLSALFPANPPRVAAQSWRWPATAAQATNDILSVAVLYRDDRAAADGFVALLNARGFTAQALQIESGPAGTTIFLPIIRAGGAGVSTQQSGVSRSVAQPAQSTPDLSAFDLLVVGADTGAGANWAGSAALREHIRDLSAPVLGVGAGGHALFGALGLDIGHPQGQTIRADSVRQAEVGASQPLYTIPNTITLSAGGEVQLYSADQDTIALALPEPLPLGVRLAAATGQVDRFPIVQSGERFLLWGFDGAPPAMTEAGRDLFLNALHFQATAFAVPLRARTFVPRAGIEQTLLDALRDTSLPDLHALVQLNTLPDNAASATLAQRGIRLLDFIEGSLFTASIDKALNPTQPDIAALVRWAGPLLPGDKVEPLLAAGTVPDWARADGEKLLVLVTVFPDVADADAETLMQGFDPAATPHAEHVWQLQLTLAQIAQLSQEDRVFWIEPGPAPLRIINDTTRGDLMVNPVQDADTASNPAYYRGLDGRGVTVAVFDTGVAPHPDFSGRLARAAADGNGHGSHVAGIVAASGAMSASMCPFVSCAPFELRGMAPGARIAPYYGWTSAEMNEAVNTHGSTISNHSYILSCGEYNSGAQNVDKLVRGDERHGDTPIPAHQAVWAAANQGDWPQYCTTRTIPDGPDDGTEPDPDPESGPRGYYSVLGPAKNALSVGATNPGSRDLAAFSSRGPTFDGRLKPEVMAPGCGQSTDHDSSGYVGKCGTSMASPAVAGVLALMTEQYHRSFPAAGRPLPATLRAIAIQTATDMEHQPGQPGFSEYGWNDPDSGEPVIFHRGPDWSTGYGIVDAVRLCLVELEEAAKPDGSRPA